MRVISKKKLKDFWEIEPDAEGRLKAWYCEAKAARWNQPADVKSHYASASVLRNDRIVFNIGGNKYRLIVHIHYASGIMFIRWIGRHAEYDKINAEEV